MEEEVKSQDAETEESPITKCANAFSEPPEDNMTVEAPGKPNGDDGLEQIKQSDSSESISADNVQNHVANNVGSDGGDSQDALEVDGTAASTTASESILVDKEKQNADAENKEINEEREGSESPKPSKTNNDILESQESNETESQISESQTYTQNDNTSAEDALDESQTFTQEMESKEDCQTEIENNLINQVDKSDIDSQANDDSQTEECKNEKTIGDASTADEKDEDVENPIFENAPESAEQPSLDDSQALDPFDELLKGVDEAQSTSTDAATAATTNAPSNPIDDDNVAEDTRDNVDPPDDALPDASLDEVGEPGQDEEVCLLPDTEREISQADREKALEAGKLLTEQASESEPKCEEVAPMVELEREAAAEPTEETPDAAEETQEVEAEQLDTDQTDAAQEDTAVANKDNDAVVQFSIPPNVIQEIGPVDSLCAQCSEDKPCVYKFIRNNCLQYICSEKCLKKFHETNGNYRVNSKQFIIEEIYPTSLVCSECEENKTCYFYYNSDGEHTNYCSLACLHSMMSDERHKYVYKRKRLHIEEIDEADAKCDICQADKCIYSCKRYGEEVYFCSQACIKKINEMENGRYKVVKRKRVFTKKTNIPIIKQPLLKLKVISNATDKYLDKGYKIQAKTPAAAAAAREDREKSFVRKCVQCFQMINGDEKNLSWETMDFCDDACLQRYQHIIGSNCANCKNAVNHTSLGKYCVRFGYDIRQFCCSTCLEEFKKGLKICCYCQRDISSGFDGFLAPVGDKGQFKDFCSKQCMAKFEQMSKNPIPQPVWAKCAVCSMDKPTQIEIGDEDHSQRLCSDPCFAAFKFVNSICPDQCRWCKKYFERKSDCCFTIYTEQSTHCFCSRACMNVYISNSRHIVPCNWCKVKKYNFDMIRRVLANGQSIMMCSLNCLNLYQVSVNAISSRRIKCDMCKRMSQAQYHLTMSDATVRNFCTYQCVMSFQGQYTKPGQPIMVGEQPPEAQKAVPTGAPRRTYTSPNQTRNNAQSTTSQQKQQQGRSSLPVISNVQSLATPPPAAKAPPAPTVHITRGKSKRLQQAALPPPEPEPPRVVTPPPPPKPLTPPPPPPPKIYNHVLVKTLPPVEVANKSTMTKPMTVTKGVSCRPHPCTKECQTDPSLERRVLIPVPVPIYVPVPIAMYSLPFPIPVPIPLPIPTPVFIPTTRNSAKGIMKEITKIHDKMPTDPFEAELLMMAEMVAGDKKKSESDSETDDENDEGFSPDAMDGGNAFGEDMLQMALKMAAEYEEPAVDLESAMTASTIPSAHPGATGLEGDAAMHHHHQMMVLEQQRAVAVLRASQTQPTTRGKRAPPAAAPVTRPTRAGKRRRAQEPPPPPEPVREPVEKPDANMCLKYTFGVNAWKQWVMTKNAEIEKSSIRRKPFKSEILQLTADELNYSLCLFVKEVRKPNGSEYAPDTIYYLVLGIQQYLFENGRIDNIFTDPYYEKFTECLDEVARKFSVLYNDSQYIVTRVEEEHLWESKQLGAHSPHVLLSTLMFFNTKHFNLVTVEEHMQLSFSHIMKHWKRSPNQPGAAKLPGSRNVLLRFYPPQSALEANSRKKKVYEQQENEENPLRCPVKLYEFYISKCPESVRTRNDVFYLLPERSCVPDSPVWYSTQALGRDALAKMLHRVKMVKEINIALLTS